MVTHLRVLCRGLEQQGIRLALAAPADTDLSAVPGLYYAVRISSRPHPVDDLRAARAAARLAVGFDLLHGHGLRGAWIAALGARIARKPFVFTAHNLAPQNVGFLSSLALRYVVSRAARVICISSAVEKRLTPYGLTTDKLVLIPNGVDHTPFNHISPRPNDPTTQRPTIVALGRLSPEKGFAILIKSIPEVLKRFPDARFTIAGDGPEREALTGQITNLGLGAVVTLPGRIEDSAPLLLDADIVVVPSLEEGQGIVALEAMAARKPVVASSVGGVVETVEDGVTGVLVPPADPKALASALIQLLCEPEAWEAMGAAGRARVEAEYTVDRMVERTVAVYREVVLGVPNTCTQ
jgi:glycosyltransferase involved in cell wall biosynthesis